MAPAVRSGADPVRPAPVTRRRPARPAPAGGRAGGQLAPADRPVRAPATVLRRLRPGRFPGTGRTDGAGPLAGARLHPGTPALGGSRVRPAGPPAAARGELI